MQRIINILNIILSALIGVMSLVPSCDRIEEIDSKRTLVKNVLFLLDDYRLSIGLILAGLLLLINWLCETK